ncbi:hypothetical protein [Chitiniphilus eburneus]|uniref:Uncharacterized protein n=1 Tax=Chitiniphilus eburneus TaxID=2571148 RepID=A0A4U0Q818_9NEIS|nr:hypothetical protein [Chitiniphilus eburneus]TJZ77403.1 hypothetical protein FAZ21_03435 [Chitiniphilus eburneus]
MNYPSIGPISSPHARTTLEAVIAYLYLLAPTLIFFLFFVDPFLLPIAALITGLSLFWCIPSARKENSFYWVISALVAGILIWIAGFSRNQFAWDWFKHWAILNEISRNDWPVSLELQGSTHYLRYYVGAYLLPALLVKTFSIITPKIAFCGYLFLGYVIICKMVLSRYVVPTRAVCALLFILALGGADFYAEHLLRALKDMPSAPFLGIHSERWAYDNLGLPIEYSSIITALIWVPHQSIPTFIFILMALRHQQFSLSFLAATFCLLAIWTPYGMIGALPIVLWLFWSRRFELGSILNIVTFVTFSAAALVVALYLSSDMPMGGACITCISQRLPKLNELLFFLLAELGIFVFILRRNIYRDRLCLISLIILLILPFTYGNTSDFVMRVSLGPIFLLSVRSIDTLMDAGPVKKKMVLAALILCLPTSINEIGYFINSGNSHRRLPQFDPLSEQAAALFATDTRYSAADFFQICGWKFLPQYFITEKPRLLKSN